MGDVVIATALFEDIAQAFPGREIHLNTLPVWEGLFVEDSRFSSVFAVDLRARQGQMQRIVEWLQRVRAGHYDLVIDLQCNDRSRLLLSLLWLVGCHIPYRLGNRRQFPYNIAPAELPKPVHTMTRCRAALEAGGISATTPRPVLSLPQFNHARVDRLMKAHELREGHYAVFMPGCNAKGYLKRWGAARYAALANRFHEDGLVRIVLIGGADEVDECQAIAETCGEWLVNLCGQTEIFDIPLLCQPARLIVANDTGGAHLASVSTTPMLVICGPTDPRRVKPLGDNVVTLQADLPCINCYRKTCSHHSCMSMLTPDRVWQRVQKLVQEAA